MKGSDIRCPICGEPSAGIPPDVPLHIPTPPWELTAKCLKGHLFAFGVQDATKGLQTRKFTSSTMKGRP